MRHIITFLLVVFCLFVTTNALRAQWTQTSGSPVVRANSLAIPVTNRFAGTYGRVSRSTENDVRWSRGTSLHGQFTDTTNGIGGTPASNLLWAPFDASTMWVQAGCGIGFAGAGIALGYAASPKEGDASGVKGGIAILLGATIASIGLPLGTYLGGEWMGGNGGWWPTLGGCLAGGCLGLVPNIFIKYDDAAVTGIVFAIAAVAGGIAAYNLSASPIYRANGSGPLDLRSGLMFQNRLHDLIPRVDDWNVRATILTITL